MVKNHPPGGTAPQDDGVGFVDDEIEHGASGLDAIVGKIAVPSFGRAGLADDSFIKATEAGTMDNGACAVEEEPQSDAARFDFGIGGWRAAVKRWTEILLLVEQEFVETIDEFLYVRPFLGSNAGRIQLAHHFSSQHTQFSIMLEVNRRHRSITLIADLLRRCRSRRGGFFRVR